MTAHGPGTHSLLETGQVAQPRLEAAADGLNSAVPVTSRGIAWFSQSPRADPSESVAQDPHTSEQRQGPGPVHAALYRAA